MIRRPEIQLTPDEVKDLVTDWYNSKELKRLDLYQEYYESENTRLMERVKDRAERHKTPNNSIPTAYYSTVVDTMGGYIGQEVTYTTSEEYQETLNEVLTENMQDVKDIKAWTHALAYNKSVELVYTVGDGTKTETRFSTISPKNTILVYNQDIEPMLYCAIYVVPYQKKKEVTVYYSNLEQSFIIEGEDILLKDERALYFSTCPVVVYRTELIGEKAPFHSIIPYVVALDWVITGNANEIDRLVDALLVISDNLDDEDLKHMDEWKTLEGFTKEDRAEYLTKDMSPEFRKYVSDLLIREIHKHSHVIDWYSPDILGEASAKALRTRLFDMDMYSKRLEMVFREGAYKRMKLIGEMLTIQGKKVDPVKITYHRNFPSDLEDKLAALNQVGFLSTQTKVEMSGLSWKEEKERLDAETPSMSIDEEIE